ncbi:hypothetical protein BH09MYX1_BH09MYX1_53830 [soil metagenome]
MRGFPELSRPDDAKYARGGREFASAADLSSAPLRVNRQALVEFLLDLYPNAPSECPNADVERLYAPLLTRASSLPPDIGDSELRATMWSHLCAGVQSSTTGATRVAVALGGIDSSGVLAALCESTPCSDIVAYTYDYADGVDEPFAEALCRAYGVTWRRLRVADAMAFVLKALVIDGLPSIGFGTAVELHLQSELAKVGIDRYLTGGFGDDLLGGEATMFGRAFLGSPIEGMKTLRKMHTPWPTTLWARVSQYVAKPLLHELFPDGLQTKRVERGLRRRAPWIARGAGAIPEHLASALAARHRPPRSPTALRKYRAPMYHHGLAARAQVVASGGVSRGDPLLAEPFARFASSVPILRLYSGGQHRGTYRKCLPARVPSSVRNRVAKAMMGDQLERFAEAQRSALAPLATVERLASLGLVDAIRFREAFFAHSPSDATIWAALSAEAFLRNTL